MICIDLWQLPLNCGARLYLEKEKAHLPKSENMKRRILEARGRETGIPFEESLEKSGI